MDGDQRNRVFIQFAYSPRFIFQNRVRNRFRALRLNIVSVYQAEEGGWRNLIYRIGISIFICRLDFKYIFFARTNIVNAKKFAPQCNRAIIYICAIIELVLLYNRSQNK